MKRAISVPPEPIKSWQGLLLELMTPLVNPRESVHGFVRGKRRGVVSNAQRHVARRAVLNFDIKRFFESIHFGRVRGVFCGHPFNFPNEVASTLAQLCTLDGVLPQGAPTSPILSNLVCRSMDLDLSRLARRHGCRYTRYADDITISSSKFLPESLATLTNASTGEAQLGTALKELLKKHGFEENPKKTRLALKHQRQSVTGLIVNERVNVPRSFIRRLRATLHGWKVSGSSAAQKKFEDADKVRVTRRKKPPLLADHVRGKLQYLRMVRGPGDCTYARYALLAKTLDASLNTPFIIGDATGVVEFLRECLWVVVRKPPSGAYVPCGTAFFTKKWGFVSAHHVFDPTNSHLGGLFLVRASAPYDDAPITSIRYKSGIDLCLLESTAVPRAALHAASEDFPLTGHKVRVVGFPNWHTSGDSPMSALAVVTQVKRVSLVLYASVDQPILSGASGGPVLDSAGRVTGALVFSPTHNSIPNAFISLEPLDNIAKCAPTPVV